MKSLRIKISVILTAVIVLLLIGVSLISYNIARNLYTEKVVKDELPLAVSNVAGEIGYAIDKIINTSYQMTKNDYLLKWIDEGEPKDGLATLFNYNTDLMKAFNLSTAMFVSDRTLNYYTNDKILKQLSKDNPRDSWYFDVKNGKEINSLNIQVSEATGSLTLYVNSKVEKDGKFYGVSAIGMNLDDIVNLVTSKTMGEGSKFLMVDSSGIVKIEKSDRVGKVNVKDVLGKEKFDVLMNKNGGVIRHFNGTRNLIIGSKYIPSLDWYLFGEMDEDVLLKDLHTLFYSAIGVILAAIIISVIVSLLMSSYLLKIILKLKTGLLSFFDLLNHKTNKAQPIEITSKDEFGQMAELINKNTKAIEDGILGEGVNIGSYNASGDAYLRFRCKIIAAGRKEYGGNIKVSGNVFDGKVYQADWASIYTKNSAIQINQTAKLKDSEGQRVRSLDAKAGDIIEFCIEYTNESLEDADNVVVSISLPNNMEYVPGSTKLINKKFLDGASTKDDIITTDGINIGHYESGEKALVKYFAVIVDNDLSGGINQLITMTKISVGGVANLDYAAVNVVK